MKMTILAGTQELKEFSPEYAHMYSDEHRISALKRLISGMEIFSGKAAGICYMKDEYFGTNVSNDEKAETRFEKVAPTGHHSIADHTFITVLFEGIPKMTAMILNALGFYDASEKSGRYTVMKSDGYDMNYILYDKWRGIFTERIKYVYSNLDDKLVEKLSLENARYMLSVLAPSTVMAYTTSLRMWSYIRDMLNRYIDRNANLLGDTDFNLKLLDCITELRDKINELGITSDKIVENKGRELNFLAKQTGFNIWDEEESFSANYLIKYKSSFAGLAQEQRHRTLDYFMCFDGSPVKYYVPEILRDTEYEEKWLEDIVTVSESYPIGTMVDVVETGLITNFLYKCDERLCGRVQLETMKNCMMNLCRFARSWHKSPFMMNQLQKHFRDGKIVMKCGNIKCMEPCVWGPLMAQDRLI